MRRQAPGHGQVRVQRQRPRVQLERLARAAVQEGPHVPGDGQPPGVLRVERDGAFGMVAGLLRQILGRSSSPAPRRTSPSRRARHGPPRSPGPAPPPAPASRRPARTRRAAAARPAAARAAPGRRRSCPPADDAPRGGPRSDRISGSICATTSAAISSCRVSRSSVCRSNCRAQTIWLPSRRSSSRMMTRSRREPLHAAVEQEVQAEGCGAARSRRARPAAPATRTRPGTASGTGPARR